MLASQDGKIVCENTLDARLDVAFRQKLPQVQFFRLGMFFFSHHSKSLPLTILLISADPDTPRWSS